MNAKYADVIKTAEVLAFFDTLPGGLFDLPKGVADAQTASDAQGGEFLARFSSRAVANRRAFPLSSRVPATSFSRPRSRRRRMDCAHPRCPNRPKSG